MKKFTIAIFSILMSFMAVSETITVTDADLTTSTTWTNDNIYLLDGFVYLEQGTLTIEAGTVIKGKAEPTSGDNASALIITTNAMIDAQGTVDNPIIFTAEYDDVEDPSDLDETDRGLWGGLILLGNGRLAFETETSSVEGIPEGELRAVYGGTDDSHNCGTLKYISIRHGGAELSPGDEINGLTLGGVGSETTIEHIEVFANNDDGFEWFGGTVECKWLVSAFNKDDGFDYDFGWRGKGQFWFVIQATDEADNAGEHDGAKPDDATPFSKPVIYNATYIGSGINAETKNSTCLHFRDAAAGTYANSIFTEFANEALEIEDLPAGSGVDSRQRMEDGDLVLANNMWWGFGSGDEFNAGTNGILRATEGGDDAECSFLITHLTNHDNEIADPHFKSISRVMGSNALVPQPVDGSLAYYGAASVPDDNFFSQVDYKGAFKYENWAAGWTALDSYGYFGSFDVMGVDDFTNPNIASLSQNYPNPFSHSTYFDITLTKDVAVDMVVYDMTGKVIKVVLDAEKMTAGTQQVTISGLTPGVYSCMLTVDGVTNTRRMIVTD